MNYNHQYEHITVKLSSLNLSLIPWFMLSYICYCTKHSLAYKFYKDNRMITTNNITRVCARYMYSNTSYCYCKISGFKTIAVAQDTWSEPYY